nr:MAG TPA: Tape measure domain protein [Caudoviricetes sp.]
MADGNLGGMSFSLGVQDNVSKELNNIMAKFVNMDISVNKATDSIRKLSAKLREANELNGEGPSKEMLKMANAIDGAATRIVRLRSEIRKTADAINQIKAIPNFMKDANLMSSLNKLQGYLRTLNSIDGNKLLDGNRIQAIFSNGARSIQEANTSLKAYKETAIQSERAVEANARAARDLASAFRQAYDAASKTSGVMNDMKSLLLQGGIVYGAKQFADSVIQTGGDIVQQHIALRSILGDIAKADTLFSQTQELALQSPFKFQELNRDVKQLAAFGVETNKLYDTTKRLADIASGLGVSFERLGLAYGQVKSRSWLDGKELRQFAYAGLPMLQKIADLYNENKKNGKSDYTTADVRKMISKREVSFDDVDSVIKKMTDKGGQFYNMQFVLSETLLGQWNKLIDAWEIMLGKFAEGEGIIGGVFKTAIKGAVAFILQLDKISPLLLSFGAVLAGKQLVNWGLNALSLNTGRIALQMSSVQAAQLKMYANSQMQAVMEGKITTEVAQQNILRQQQLLGSKAIKEMAYAQLFAEGKINAAQIAGLMRRGEVSSSLIVQLRQMQLISAEQEKLILLAAQEGNTRKGNLAMMRLSTSGIGSGLGGLMSTGNIAMMGAAVGLALWMGYSQWNSRIEQQMEAAVQHARQQIEIYSKGIETASSSGVTEDSVRNMQDIVESSDLYSKSMKEQVDHAKTLQEKYDVLLDVIKQMGEQSKAMIRYSQESSEMIKATSVSATSQGFNPMLGLGLGFATDYAWDFLFNDDIEKNITDYERSHGLFQNIGGELEAYKRQIIEAMSEIKGSYADVYAEIQGKPFEEQLRILSESDAWGEINRRISQSDTSFSGLADTYQSRSKDVTDDWNEIVNDDIPRMFAKAAYERGMDLEDYKNYCRRNPEYTQDMIRSIVHQLKNGSAETKGKLSEALIAFFGLAKEYADRVRVAVASDVEIEKPLTPYDKQTDIGKRLMRNIVDKYGNGVITTAELNTIAKDEDDWAKVASNIKKQYSSNRESYLAAVAGHASSSELAPLYKEQEKWRKVALANGITPESKSDKKAEAAKRKAERAAEQARRAEERRQREILRGWQSRKKLLEEYYETWNKWRNIEGKEDAKARLRNDKRFAGVNKDYTDPENLSGNLSKLVKGYEKLAKTKDQRNFLAETRTEAAKKEAELEYSNAERQVKALGEQLDILSRQYDIYQKLSKFTTSAAAAEYAFGSYSVNRATKKSYYGYLRDTLNSLQGKKVTPKPFVDNSMPDGDKDKRELDDVTVTASTKRIDFGARGLEGVLSMTDEDIENEFGKNRLLVKNILDFKKERAALDSEIADGLSKGYEFEDDYAAQIEYNNKRLDEQIERLRERNKLSGDHPQHISNDTLAEAELNLRKKTTRENNDLSFKQMQRETGWSVALGNLGAMSSGVVDRIKREIETRLDAGNLSDDERGKLNEALTKLNEQFEKSDPFSSIVKGYDIVKAIDSIRNGSKDKNGQYTIDAQKARSVGLKVSKDNKYSDADLDEAQANVFRGFDTSIKAISDGFQSLQTVLQPVVDLFDSLGNKGIGEGAEIAGKAFSSASNVAGGLNTMRQLAGPDSPIGKALGSAGPYVAAASAAVSVFTSLWNKKTTSQKAYEKQAEYLKNIQGAVKEINGSLKEKVSSSFGSQAQDFGLKVKKNLETEAQELRRTYFLWTEAKEHRGGHRNRVRVSDFAKKLNEWLKDNGLNKAIMKEILLPRLGWMNFANGGRQITNFGSQELQWLNGDVLRRYREEHAGEWANLNSTAKEIFNRLIEIEGEGGEIQKTTEETAKALTDMDLSSLKSEWVDLLNNLDSANEDFADNFEKHMRNAILNGMIANQYSDQLKKLNEENAKRGGSEKGNKYVAKDGSIKQHTGGDDSKEVLSEYTAEEYRLSAEAYKELSEQARQTRDVLKKIYGWSDKDSKSRAGSNIKGITENTADIIASYLNAIRADVFVDRPNIQRIADAVASMPEMSGIAQSQLSQLTTLVTLAQYRNGRLDDMYDWMRSVTKEGGTKHLAI